MKSVVYEQTWDLEDYILDMEHTVERVWDDQEQIQWLIDQGYEPKIDQRYNKFNESVSFIMQFMIKEPDLTFLMLKWPEARSTLDFA